MTVLDRWAEILETLARHRLRTALTALSVAWGIFVLVVLVGVGDGLSKAVAWQFRDDATNSVWLWRGRTSVPWRGHGVGRQVRFTNRDFDQIARTDGIDRITGRFHVWGESTVSYGDRRGAYGVRAVHPEHRYLENTIVVRGRYLDALDVAEQRKVTVIGQEVADYLFRGADPIGAWIDVNRIQYQVVGVFEDEGGPGEVRMIYIPITTAQAAYGGGEDMHQIMFTVDPDATVEQTEAITDRVRWQLASTHRFAPHDKRALRVRNNVESFQKVSAILDLLRAFTTMVGLGTMCAGVVGVSNIMLVSVSERTSEFGLRKALGATPASIVWLVLQEAMLLTSVAGWFGLVLGLVAVEGVARYAPELDYMRDPEVSAGPALAALGVLVIAGAVAGFFPAWRAARVQPVEALRQ